MADQYEKACWKIIEFYYTTFFALPQLKRATSCDVFDKFRKINRVGTLTPNYRFVMMTRLFKIPRKKL